MSKRGRKPANRDLDSRSLQNSFDLTSVTGVDLKEELANMTNIGIDIRDRELTYEENLLLNASDLQGHIRRIVAKSGVREVSSQVLAVLSDAIQIRLLDVMEDMRDLSIQRTDARKYSEKAMTTHRVKPYLSKIEKRERDAWKGRLEPSNQGGEANQDLSLLEVPLDELTEEQRKARQELERKQEQNQEIKTANTLALTLITEGTGKRGRTKRKKNNAKQQQKTNDDMEEQTTNNDAMETETTTSSSSSSSSSSSLSSKGKRDINVMELQQTERNELRAEALDDRQITFLDGMEWLRNDPRVGVQLITKWHMIDEGQHLVKDVNE